jgi:hypothetical protein
MPFYFYLIPFILIALYFLVIHDGDEPDGTYNVKEDEYNHEKYNHEKSSKNEKTLEKIINLMIKDFNNSPYDDKITVYKITSWYFLIYNFNNGYRITLNGDFFILYNSKGETINTFYVNQMQSYQIIELANEFKKKSVGRNYRTYDDSWRSKKYSEYNEYKKEQTKAGPKKETTGNLKLDKILEKIKLRKEQLVKMKSNDPDRLSLVNELKTYENVANKMKSKLKD